MNKVIKTILIISIAVFGAGFLFTLPTFAQAANLEVQFEQTPLFSETNFLPGESVTRWVKVTNNSGQTQRIATEAINVSDPDRLGDVLNLEIKENEITRYSNPLSKFFTAGEVYLSDLANGAQTQYDFIVTFYSGAGNPFQGKSLKFDILIGFQGTEGGLLPGAGTGAGGFLPPGLTIQDESVRVTTTTETSVTITWTTSYFSTSQVIYAKAEEKHTLDLTDNVGIPPYPPKYGYAHTTLEYDTSPKVTFHSVTISGLEPGTTYYFRTVSHGSLAISREYSFTTLGEKVGEKTEEKPPEETGPSEITEEVVPPKEEVIPPKEEVTPPEKPLEPEGIAPPEGAAPAEEGIVTVPPEERAAGIGLGPLLLASLGEIGETPWMAILVVFCLIGLVVVGIREWELARRKKKKIS